MFYDFCIPFNEDIDKITQLLKRAQYLGYNAVAIEHTVKDKLTQNHVNPILGLLKKIKAQQTKSDKVTELDFVEEEKERPTKKIKSDDQKPIETRKNEQTILFGLHIYTRLTMIIEQANDAKGINNTPNAINQYDIIAAQVEGDERVLNMVLKNLDIDLVSITLNCRLPYFIKYSTVQPGLERDIFFEVKYGNAIRDIDSRKFLFSNASLLARALKAKNLIFTSGCESPIELRAPFDVTNLGELIGLNRNIAKKMVSDFGRQFLVSADTRKNSAKGVVSLIKD
ncbi:PHP domain-like protein [Neoconidiobolus thromboides FSU 785]|nr:PHP domain-like protein [Neoconidiobolus thromboides FSU 785]